MHEQLKSHFDRHGSRYVRPALFVGVPTGYLTGLLATAGTALYIDITVGEFLRLFAASSALIWTPEAIMESRFLLRRSRPVIAWLDGPKETTAAAAWETTASLPLALLRQRAVYVVGLIGIAVWGLYATWELDLPAYSIVVFYASSVLIYSYWLALRFLALELVLQPVLERIAAVLPTGVEVSPLRLSLRWRLLAALPAVNLITGLAVGGFSAGSSDDIGGLGLALLGSVTAAILVSSWLVWLLSTSITTPVIALRDASRRVGGGDFSTRVPVSSTDESGELASAFNLMVEGLGQRELLRDAFGTFVDPALTERILSEGTDLAGEDVEVSLMFVDVRGFTSYSERAQARDVVARLNALYAEVVPLILREQGHANKFIGDGLLAVFGAPNRLPDHAERAVAAGLAIARRVEERFEGELQVGIGINSGEAVVGTIGGGGRLDFTVIGDAVNTAARVEAVTRQTGDILLITEATRSLLNAQRNGWVERPSVPLKGKADVVRLYAPSTRN